MFTIQLPDKRVVTDGTWLASYPRSGSMFLRSMLYCEWNIKSASPVHTDMNTDLSDQNSKLIATHLLPMQDDWRFVYVLRDGREVCVSVWHANKAFNRITTTLADVIRGDLKFGELKIGLWSDHVKAWQRQHDRLKNALIIRYETMKDDRAETMRQLGAFLNLEPTGNAFPTFESLRRQLPKYFRSGTNTTWKEEMTGSDLDLFYELHGETMEKYGYECRAVKT